MKIKKLLVAIIVVEVLFLICLAIVYDPFYEWKLNRAKTKYGIELRPENMEWEVHYYRLDTKTRQYNVNYDDGRYLTYTDERHLASKLKQDDTAIKIRYGWAGDSIVPSMELISTYVFDNKLFYFELRDTVFQKYYVHYLNTGYSETGEEMVRPDVVYDEFIDYAEFLEMKLSWGQGEKTLILPGERQMYNINQDTD